MFYNLLYFDNELFENYFSIANAGRAIQFKEVESETDKNAKLGSNNFNLGLSKSSTLKGEVVNNSMSKLISLEDSLENNDFYADFESGESEKSIDSLSRRMIFRATVPLKIHEDFDLYETMGAMKDQLLNPELTQVKSDEAELFESIFNINDVTLPVYNDEHGTMIFSKLNKNNLLVDDNEIEELEEENIILAKVKKKYNNNFTLFDPLKDFMNLNRTMRKEMKKSNKDNKELSPIIVNSGGLEVEIIAIYS